MATSEAKRPGAAERPQESGAAALGRGGRLSRQRKTAAVLRLLRGEDLETERFIRTLKENLLWVRSFDTVEELRVALIEFREIYNATWLIERHGFRPPNAVRRDQLSSPALAA